MSDRWLNELERIKRQKQEERRGKETGSKAHRERIQEIHDQWDETIKSLLEHIAEATWADQGLTWKIEHLKPWQKFADQEQVTKILWSVRSYLIEGDPLSRGGFNVYLVVDINAGYLPREFLIDCYEQTLHAEPSLEALRSTLLEAYKAGPRVWGVPSTEGEG